MLQLFPKLNSTEKEEGLLFRLRKLLGKRDAEIRELKMIKNALEEAKSSLAAKIRERTKELEEAKSVLEVKVQARTKELQELADSLEEQVKGRTQELQGKITELEKFQTLAVGRELKMIELKNEIKKFKEKIKKTKS